MKGGWGSGPQPHGSHLPPPPPPPPPRPHLGCPQPPQVPPLPAAAAAALVSRIAPDLSAGQAQKLGSALRGLPLALRLACGALVEGRLSVQVGSRVGSRMCRAGVEKTTSKAKLARDRGHGRRCGVGACREGWAGGPGGGGAG